MDEVKKKGAYFNLHPKVLETIKCLAAEKKISQGEVIEFVVERFMEERSEEHKLLKDTLSTLLAEELLTVKDDLKRIRVTANVIDRLNQMQMEFWNHYFVVSNFQELGSTEKLKTNEFIEAELIVKNRIAHNRQRKLDRENSQKKKET